MLLATPPSVLLDGPERVALPYPVPVRLREAFEHVAAELGVTPGALLARALTAIVYEHALLAAMNGTEAPPRPVEPAPPSPAAIEAALAPPLHLDSATLDELAQRARINPEPAL